MKKVILVCLILVAAMVAALSTASNAEGTGKPEFVTICHAAGQEGTTQFVTLTLPYNAVYGQAGHFNEPGTPAAGHEQDYEGACIEEPPVECPDGDFNGEEPGCGEPPVECPNGDFNGEEPGCGEPPVECPNGDLNGELPGCEEEPPVECPNGDLNGPEPGCETVVVPPRCPPGEGPYDGKDGEPGNEECCPDANNDQKCDEATPPPVAPPVVEPPVVEPPVVQPPVTTPPVTKPKPEKPKTVKPPKTSTDGPVSKPKPVTPTEPTATPTDETLPHTGLSLLWAVALGLLLSGIGVALMRKKV